MLKLAISYNDKLNVLFQEKILDDKYIYWNYCSWSEYNLKLETTNWNSIQYVSIDNDNNILGYFSADINRDAVVVNSLSIIGFYDTNIIFAKDLYKFIDNLFTKFNFRKIDFSVVIGNPIEKSYDKLIKKYNGRIVGVFKEDTLLRNRKYGDVKHYEIFRKDYIKSKQERRKKHGNI